MLLDSPPNDRNGDQDVSAPQRHDVRRVVLLLDFTAHLPLLEPSQLKTIQVAHELVHELRSGGRSRPHAMRGELVEHLRMIGVRQCGQASVMDGSR